VDGLEPGATQDSLRWMAFKPSRGNTNAVGWKRSLIGKSRVLLYRVATRVTFFRLAMTSLPRQLPARLSSSPQLKSAYTLCLLLESKIQSEIATKKTAKDRNELSEHLIYCRVVGYLLHHAPNDVARGQVRTEIVSCNGANGDAKLIQLGKMYFDHFIRACTYNPRSAFKFKLTYVSSSEEQRTDTRSIVSRIPSIL